QQVYVALSFVSRGFLQVDPTSSNWESFSYIFSKVESTELQMKICNVAYGSCRDFIPKDGIKVESDRFVKFVLELEESNRKASLMNQVCGYALRYLDIEAMYK